MDIYINSKLGHSKSVAFANSPRVKNANLMTMWVGKLLYAFGVNRDYSFQFIQPELCKRVNVVLWVLFGFSVPGIYKIVKRAKTNTIVPIDYAKCLLSINNLIKKRDVKNDIWHLNLNLRCQKINCDVSDIWSFFLKCHGQLLRCHKCHKKKDCIFFLP